MKKDQALATSDNGFISRKLKNKSKEKKILWAVLEDNANPANQLISGKITKMALFNPCIKFEKFSAK